MNSIGAIKTMDADERQLQEAIRYDMRLPLFSFRHLFHWNSFFYQFSDILASAIRLCVYPIDFSIYAACPRAHDDSRELSVSGKFLSFLVSS